MSGRNLLFISCHFTLLFKLCGKLFQPGILLENGTSVADLSRFERGNHQPAGVYRVDLWRNDEFIGSQDIVFESTTVNTGDKSGGLMPCFNQALLERIGLNSSAFPELAQQQIINALIY